MFVNTYTVFFFYTCSYTVICKMKKASTFYYICILSRIAGSKIEQPLFGIHQPVRPIHESAWAQGAGINERPAHPVFTPTTSQPVHLLTIFASNSSIVKFEVVFNVTACYVYTKQCFVSFYVRFNFICKNVIRFKITMVVSLEGYVLFCGEVRRGERGDGGGDMDLWEAAHKGRVGISFFIV